MFFSPGPSAPENVQVLVSTSSALTVAWEPPDPPNGEIVAYELKYWTSRTLGQPETVNFPADVFRHNISSLKATTGYGIQVMISMALIRQKRHNSIANALELRLVCLKPSKSMHGRHCSRVKAVVWCLYFTNQCILGYYWLHITIVWGYFIFTIYICTMSCFISLSHWNCTGYNLSSWTTSIRN